MVVDWRRIAPMQKQGWGKMRRALAASGVLGALISSAWADVPRLGSEIQVNVQAAGAQELPAVATDSAGGFVVAWTDLSGLDGADSGVFARRFDSEGASLGAVFQVNSHTSGSQYDPAIAMDASGGFLLVWSSTDQDGSGAGVFGQRYDSTAEPLGAEFRINASTIDHQRQPAVAMDASGRFVVTWNDYADISASGIDIIARRFESTGVPLGGEFPVSRHWRHEVLPAVAVDASGRFVVAWTDVGYFAGRDGSGYGVFARRFDDEGRAIRRDFQVNRYTLDHQALPALGMEPTGGFVVVWTSYEQDRSGWGIFARRFHRTGRKLGREFRVNTHTADWQHYPSTAMDSTGAFLVAWTGYGGQDGSGTGIFGRRYDSKGAPLGGEFQINTYTTGTQRSSAVAMASASDFVVVWTSFGQDGSENGVFAQRFSCPDAAADGLCDG